MVAKADQSFHLRLTPDEYEWLRRTAYLTKRTMTSVIRLALSDLRQKEGLKQ